MGAQFERNFLVGVGREGNSLGTGGSAAKADAHRCDFGLTTLVVPAGDVNIPYVRVVRRPSQANVTDTVIGDGIGNREHAKVGNRGYRLVGFGDARRSSVNDLAGRDFHRG